MAARLFPVDEATIADIHSAARRSLYWEMDPGLRAVVEASGVAEDEKHAWLRARIHEDGNCGVGLVITDDDALPRYTWRGTALLCSPPAAAGAIDLPAGPTSADACLLTSLFLDHTITGIGLESVLLDAAIIEAMRRGHAAIEAYGLHPDVSLAAVDARVLEAVIRREDIGLMGVEDLYGAGFEIVRDHPVLPRLRLELPPAQGLLSVAAVHVLMATAGAVVG